MEGGDTGGYSHGVLKSMTNNECHSLFHLVFICGSLLSSVGMSFPYAGGRFQMWVVIFVRGRLSRGGGGGGLPWPVSVFCCHIAVSDVAPGFPVSKESGGRGVCTHLLVVIAASDVAPQCRWQGGGVGCSSPLVLLVGGVLLSCRCCGMVIVCCGCGCGESSLSLVMATDVAFLRRSDGVPSCPGGCWWWAVVWQRWVGVVGGCHEWVSWVGIVGGGRWWWWWWWWLRKKEVVVC